MEEWRPLIGVSGFENCEISSLARVRRVGCYFCMSDFRSKGGYRSVQVQESRVRHRYPLHRLVALAFIPRPAGCDVVNHINRIRTDNRPENLEWTTQAGNVEHARAAGSYKNRRKSDLRAAA
jgi:hypothetical protein